MVLSHKTIQNAYQAACLDELQALKPGNVHIFADGHDMDIAHFIQSAEVSAPALCHPNASVGTRILSAVQATHQAVGMNTNLGIILLCAPLVHAADQFIDKPLPDSATLQLALQASLAALTVEDGRCAAQAIMLACPAGLGAREELDVKTMPEVSLLALMQAAQADDRIAFQYATGYADLFGKGLDWYQDGLNQWEQPAWATSWLYLNYLCAFTDSHIVRKYGNDVADGIVAEALEVRQYWQQQGHPKYLRRMLLDWDTSLKKRRLNPGTSADFTVTTLLMHALCKSL